MPREGEASFSIVWRKEIKKMGKTAKHYALKVGLTDMEISVILNRQPEIIELAKFINHDLHLHLEGSSYVE